ncbi:MAG TPA: secretin N-terminal domain-containing protein, partial [Verrucomicrobiae bacterium]|nr:secretin N-terminal domain-containing protein [Verrucomicrobiae bacterium]
MLGLSSPPGALAAKGVVLNFSEVDISTMVKFISDLTGRNFVMDDRVKGKISVFSPTKLTPDEAFNVFTSVLELKGFTVVPSGKVFKIVPTSSAKQSGMKVGSGTERATVNDAYTAQVIPLENISSQEAMTFLQPMVSKDGHISAFGPGNLLLVVDSALNIQKLLSILQLIDTDQRRRAELITLKHASADTAAALLRDWLAGRDKGAKGAAAPAAGAAGTTVVADTRLNALLVTGSDRDKEDIRAIVELLDVPSPTTTGKINVYYLENADAVEVAKVLEGIVKGGSIPAAAPGQPQPAAAAQQQVFEGGRIGIMPDKSTNSLV